MILTLKNFKCFVDAKFRFLDNTNTLITAHSGYGKSTIFEAIRFVLWGNRDVDVVTFGKKKCEVILEYKGCVFRRTKNPNFFSIMSEKHGTIENPTDFVNLHFPKYPTNFISYNGIKQMQILEKISNNKDVDGIKEKIKKVSQQGTKHINELKISLEVTKKSLSKLSLIENNIKPEKTILMSEKDCFSKIQELEAIEKRYILNNMMYDNHISTINSIVVSGIDIKYENLEDLELILKDNKFQIEKYQSDKYQLAKLEALILPESTVNSLDDLELKLYQAKSDKIQNEITTKKISAIWNECTEHPNGLSISDDVEIFNKVISEYSDFGGKYKCPCCSTSLNLEGEKLVSIKECVDLQNFKKIVELKNSIIDGENINKIPEIVKDCKRIMESIEASIEVEVINLKLRDTPIDKIITETEQITKHISDARNKAMFEKKIEFLSKVDEDIISDLSFEISDLRNILNDIKTYEFNMEKWAYNEKLNNLIFEYREEIQEKEHELSAAIKLAESVDICKRLVEESQSKSLSSLIKIINREVRYFSSLFFQDDLVLKLEEFKQVQSTKALKPQIDVSVVYKGTNMKISNLSSGEYARAELALDLVLYKMINSSSPLLLDEVTANLDSETSSKIFNTINRYFKDKDIFIIAHQAIEGVFDNTFSEEKLDELSRRSM